ncbi:cation efflux family-domain-containing protein [Pyronema omphalodes]|nr:cation efflux family-domain-containing protein [Pyronema omphalodes]
MYKFPESHDHDHDHSHDHSHGNDHAHEHNHDHSHHHDTGAVNGHTHEHSNGTSHSHDHSHDHGHDHEHGHSHDSADRVRSDSVSSQPPIFPPNYSLNGTPRTRTHRYTPSTGRLSIGNGYALPGPRGSIISEHRGSIAEGAIPVLAYAAAQAPTASLQPKKRKKQDDFMLDDHSDPIALTLSSLTTPLLITTTLLLASITGSKPINPLVAPTDDAPQTPVHPTAVGFMNHVCTAAAITSGTLFLGYAVGFGKQLLGIQDESGGYTRRKPLPVTAGAVMGRMIGVWACYYAALELGGVRASLLVLACLASGLDGAGIYGLGQRKALVVSILSAAGWDIWRTMNSEAGSLEIILANIALVGGMMSLQSPWACSIKNTQYTNGVSLAAAVVSGIVALAGYAFGFTTLSYQGLTIMACIVGAAGMVLDESEKADTAYGAGVFAAITGAWVFGLMQSGEIVNESGLGALAMSAVSYDKYQSSRSNTHNHSHSHGHDHSHDHDHHGHDHSHDAHKPVAPPSAATKFLIQRFSAFPLIHGILLEKDSRRIAYFMVLNFAFMIVQTAYGFLTGSLGLISDSVHMFFDCLALGVGVCAAVMSKWPASTRYPYGLGKMDTLAGFANGIFLMLISVEIVFEALERLKNPTDMSRLGELFVVSTAGLAVNMVGIFAFDHAHVHGGHSHGHSHGGAGGGDHGGDNMHGIFLHILADALGSVSVVISTMLIHYTGWTGFDPLASMLIAILIFASSIPLVVSAAKNLLLTVDAGTEYTLRETISGISVLPGVSGYQATRFWESERGALRGVVHIQGEGDTEIVRRRVEEWLKQNVEGVDVTVVVEREGEGCWCKKKE